MLALCQAPALPMHEILDLILTRSNNLSLVPCWSTPFLVVLRFGQLITNLMLFAIRLENRDPTSVKKVVKVHCSGTMFDNITLCCTEYSGLCLAYSFLKFFVHPILVLHPKLKPKAGNSNGWF